MFKKLISFSLSIALLAGLFSLPLAQAANPVYTNQCETYKTHLDRTQTSNRPVADYIAGLDGDTATTIINQIKADSLCMQKADLQYKITKMNTAATRAAVQAQLDNVLQQEQKLNEQLRAQQERADRISKFLESLRALSKAGLEDLTKQLTDTKSELLEDFNTAYTDQVEEIKNDAAFQDQRLKTIKNTLEDYNNATTIASKNAIKAEVKARLTAAYKVQKEKLLKEQNRIKNELLKELDSLLIVEAQKFTEAVEAENLAADELNAVKNAFATLQQEIKQKYEEEIDLTLKSATTHTDQINSQIEKYTGVVRVDETAFNSYDLIRSISSKFASVSNTIVANSTKATTELTAKKIQELRNNVQIMRELNFIAHSAETKLLEIFDDTALTKNVIEALEKDNDAALETIVASLDDKQVEAIQVKYAEQKKDIIKRQEDLDAENTEYLTTANLTLSEQTEERIKTEKLVKEVKLACKKYPKLNSKTCASIVKITQAYGGYGDFLVDLFSKQPQLQNTIEEYQKQALEGLVSLQKELINQGNDLKLSQQKLLKFQVLASLHLISLEQKIEKLKNKYEIKNNFKSVVKKEFQTQEKKKKFLESYNPSQSCKLSELDEAVKELLLVAQDLDEKSFCKSSGALHQINALRQAFGKNEFKVKVQVIDNQDNQNKNYKLEKNNGKLESVYFLNDKGQVEKKLTNAFLRIYQYDSQGRLSVKASYSTKYLDKNLKILSYVDSTTVTWYYVGNTDVIKGRVESQEMNTKKVIQYSYLYDDIQNINKFTGNKRIMLNFWKNKKEDILKNISDKDQRKYLVNVLDTAYKSIISQISVSGVSGQQDVINDFFYNEDLQLVFIDNKDGIIFTDFADKEDSLMYKNLPVIGKQLNLKDVSNKIGNYKDPMFFLDSSGLVIANSSNLIKSEGVLVVGNILFPIEEDGYEVSISDIDNLKKNIKKKVNSSFYKQIEELWKGDAYRFDKEEMIARNTINMERAEMDEYQAVEWGGYNSIKWCVDSLWPSVCFFAVDVRKIPDGVAEYYFDHFLKGSGDPLIFDIEDLFTVRPDIKNDIISDVKKKSKNRGYIKGNRHFSQMDFDNENDEQEELIYRYGSFDIEWIATKKQIFIHVLNQYTFNVDHKYIFDKNLPTNCRSDYKGFKKARLKDANQPEKECPPNARITYPLYGKLAERVVEGDASDYYMVGLYVLDLNEE